MSAKSSEHTEVSLLIPWYANGTLSGPDLLTVSRHLKVCADCRLELAQMQQLSVRWQEESAAPDHQGNFARLLATIEQEEQGAERGVSAAHPEPRNHKPQVTHRRRLWDALHDWTANPAGIPAGGLALASVAGALIVVALMGKNPQWSDTQSFRTLGTRGSMASLGEKDLHIVFAPDVRSEQITSLIGSLNARIVDGPSEIGAYTVRLNGTQPAANGVAEVAAQLRDNPMILMAEPALPPAADRSTVVR